ncbi:MAG: beta-lactamase regulating signal transducer with metallopeptidase domain [Crocinitomicaceae bacterium]|jgi:beta-lactamase regulating signal transducer with metallopeptidase domain
MDAIRISLILSISAYFMSVWLGKKSPARASSLTSGMTILLLIAPILLTLPKWHIQLSWLNQETSGQSSPAPLESSWLSIAIVLWATGSVIFFFRYLLQANTLRKWVSSSTAVETTNIQELLAETTLYTGLKKKPALRHSPMVTSPVVAGLFRPTILIPEKANSWDLATLRMVLLHELGHIRRRDLWVSHIANLNCIVHWFNPFVWLLRNRLRSQCEFAVDAQIIANGTDAKCYITALCNVAENLINKEPTLSTALAMADKASLRNRVNSLLTKQKSPSPLMVGLLLAITVSSTFAFAVIRPQAPSVSSPGTQVKPSTYSIEEVELRMSASAFPGDL